MKKLYCLIFSLMATVLFAETNVKNIEPGEADKAIRENKVVVLDLRTPKEFKAGHIAGARLIDFLDPLFEQELARLDKSKTYLIHCASGNRSTQALDVFKKLKFTSVLHLDGGFQAWQKSGKPVEK